MQTYRRKIQASRQDFEKRLNEEHYRIHSDGQQPYSKMSVPLIQGKCWLKSPGETSIFFPKEEWSAGKMAQRLKEYRRLKCGSTNAYTDKPE